MNAMQRFCAGLGCIAGRRLRWLGLPLLAVVLVGAVVSADAPPAIPAINLAAEPLYAKGARAKPTLTLALSVEFPTVGAQYVSGVDGATDDATYSPDNEYVGYFDAESCYVYNNTPTGVPAGVATADYKRFDWFKAAAHRTCGGDSFSGNFLNWASASAVDILRYGLSGGDRWVDTTALTILQRAYLPTTGDNNNGNFWNGNNFPSKQLSATLARGAVPDALRGQYNGTIYVANCKDRMHFGTAATGSCDSPGANSSLGVPDPSATVKQVGAVEAYSGSASTAITRFGGAQCAVESLASNGYAGYTATTTECAFTGVKTVIYGVENGVAPNNNGSAGWRVASVANGITCSSAAFGNIDPAPGTYKKCYVRDRIDGDPSLGSIVVIPPSSTALTSDNFFYVRVSVCALNAGALTDPRTDLCLRYPNGNYKPVGNLQRYSDRIRVAAFGYLLDNADVNQRQGGVLRVPMKYVGPKTFDANFSLVSGANPQAEWNESTGVLIDNPDSASPELYSGITNYLNRFGRTGPTPGRYKRRDPVSELYYESLRYLQGLTPTPQAIANLDTTPALKDGFPAFSAWTDPHPSVTGMSDYSCVRNNILAIGDVNTNADLFVPGNPAARANSNDPARAANASGNEPDFHYWTKVVGAFESNHAVSYDDGKGVPRSTANPNPANGARWQLEDQTFSGDAGYYMAGMAYWANTHDIRGSAWTEAAKRRPGMRVTTYMLDVNEFGQQTAFSTHKNNPYFLAAKYGGFSDVTGTGNPFKGKATDAAGETVDSDGNINTNINWENPPNSGKAKNYFLSSSARAVLTALNQIFERVAQEANSIAGGAISTQRLTSSGGFIYQAQFDPSDWSGDLVAYGVSISGTTVDISGTTSESQAAWKASARLDRLTDTTTRNIFVGKSTPIGSTNANAFAWASLDADAKTYLRTSPIDSTLEADTVGQARLDFLRGVRTLEAPGGSFRKRGALLGDIVNSGVAYSGAPAQLFSGSDYTEFYDAHATRTKALFVGANDGMLHAFNAETGDELFAYIPSWVVPRLAALTSPSYRHQSYVDASPVVAEAKLDDGWKTVVVGGTGAGGQGVYALDVSDPHADTNSKGAEKLLWEFTDRDDADLGNVIGRPRVLKMRVNPSDATKDRYFAVFASGVNNYVNDGHFSLVGNPALFLLDLSKPKGTAWALGGNYYKIVLPNTLTSDDPVTPRGMAGFSVRIGVSREVTSLYAGDLQGNLWKLDFANKAATDWTIDKLSYFKDSDGHALPMYIARDGSGKRQPITMEPALVFGSNRDIYVAFGTGKFLETSDTSGPHSAQSVYALLDNNTPKLDATSGSVAAISGRGRLKGGSISGTAVSVDNFVWGRALTNDDATSAIRSGWYFDFASSASTGERQISGMAILAGRIIFGSVIPAVNSCEAGNGNLYTIYIASGDGRSEKSRVGILGEPFVTQVGAASKSTISDTTGMRRQDTRYQIILQGSAGLSAPSTQSMSITSYSGRMSWREISNYQELRRAP